MYAAAIAVSSGAQLDTAVQLMHRHSVQPILAYEVMLQSYLFLGFPRMLIAAEHLYQLWPEASSSCGTKAPSADDMLEWRKKGESLCQKVYGGAFAALQRKIMTIAPEAFQWMLLEGYGKVLSRPELGAVERELAVVATLMMDNRPQQLHSHILGALNVGAELSLVRQVVDDIGISAGDGFGAAREILLGLSVAS
ncbi:MAG: carboxymuconolactone decarboxylase family protein [Candidatus Zixiibacteriota bacterium]